MSIMSSTEMISVPCDHVLKIVYGVYPDNKVDPMNFAIWVLMRADGNGSTTWCKYVKDLLLIFSMTHLWENQ